VPNGEECDPRLLGFETLRNLIVECLFTKGLFIVLGNELRSLVKCVVGAGECL